MKTLCACLILMVSNAWSLSAQEILFSKPFRAQNYATCEVLGKVNKNYIVLEEGVGPYGKKFLRIFDQQMKQVGDKKKVRMPPGAQDLAFFVYDSFLVKTYVEKAANSFLLQAIFINASTLAEAPPLILDSMSFVAAAQSGTWKVVPSLDKSKLLVNRVRYGYDSASISTIIFDDQLRRLQFSDFKIFLLGGQEVVGDFFISNQGDIYFSIQPLKGGISRFEILSKPFNDKYYRSVLVDLKSKYLNKNALTFTIEEGKNSGNLLINATYYSKGKSTVDEGFFSARVNSQTNRSKAVFNPLRDSIFSSGKINSSSNNTGQITLNKVFVLSNGSVMLVGEIDRTTSALVGTPREYLNRTIVDPRQVYTPGYADQSPYTQQPMYISPGAYAPRLKLDLYNKDIVVCYLDSSLRLQRQTVIEKDQDDIKKEMPLFLSLAAVNTATGVHLLYRELQRGGGILRNNRFSPSGEMARLPPFKTFYDSYRLIPAYAKQVGLRQVIVPGVYRGKTVFAKIDL